MSTRNPRGNEAKCCTCQRIFSTVANFDKHWDYKQTPKKCCTDEQLAAKRLIYNTTRGVWQHPANPNFKPGSKIASLEKV